MLPPACGLGQVDQWGHFRHLFLTDEQLLRRLKDRWPDFAFARETIDGQDAWTGAPIRSTDSWVVRFTERGIRQVLAIAIQNGQVWLSFRWSLYCAYVFDLSGGGS
jgi:hypothetical protein